MTKAELRRRARAAWRRLDLKALSRAVGAALLPWLRERGFRHILLYHPLPHELNLLPLMEAYPARYYLPKVAGKGLTVHPFGPLAPGPFGLLEPTTPPEDPRVLDLVVVPFDEIFQAVKSGVADIGLIIHEGQLTYANEGFVVCEDLGVWWGRENDGLPLPLGGNVAMRHKTILNNVSL